MSEFPGKNIEPKVAPKVFNEATSELIRLGSRGRPITQEENQGFYDYEEFTELELDGIVGKQSNHKTAYEGMTLDIDVLIYGEAANSLEGSHAISYLFVTLINSEYEFLVSTKYRFHVDGSVIKAHTSGIESLLSEKEIETSMKLLQRLGIDPTILGGACNGTEELELETDELKRLVTLLSKVPS